MIIYFPDYCNRWIENERKFLKESTFTIYSTLIRTQIIPEFIDMEIKDIDSSCLQRILTAKLNKGLKLKTVKDVMSLTLSILHSAMRENTLGFVKYKLKYPKETEQKTKHLTKDEENVLLNYCLSNINPKTVGILLVIFTGIRIGEVCSIKWSDIDLDRKVINISKTLQRLYFKDVNNSKGFTKVITDSPKSKKSSRHIPLVSKIYEVLQVVKSRDDYYLITNNTKYCEPRTLRESFRRIMIKLDLPNITFHGLRHTFATRCIENGAEYKTLSEILGHSSITTTMNLYVHIEDEQKRKTLNFLDQIF
jgi:integrase